MKKLLGLLSLAIVSLYLVSGATEALAQNKKTGKQGTIELIQSKDGKYRFSIRDSEGKYLAGSPVGHATEKEAREAVEDLKAVIGTAKYVSKKTETKEKKEKDGGKDK